MKHLFSSIFATGIVFASATFASAQSDPVDVILKSTDVEFANVFDFAESGVLHTGGITTDVIIRRMVPEHVSETRYKTVLEIVDGQVVFKQVPYEVTHTVYKPVFEARQITLPAMDGIWFGADDATWLILSGGPTGVAAGAGTRNGDGVDGWVLYFSLDGAPPTGIYQVQTAADAP